VGTTDDQRLAALKQGISQAPDIFFVAIRVGDLRWLLDQVDALRQRPDVTTPSPFENN